MKNTTCFYRTAFLSVLYSFAVLIFGGCTDEETNLQYLRLPEDTYTVSSEGSESLTIKVSANPAWSYKIEQGNWLSEVSHDAQSLVLKVFPNDYRTERIGTISFSNELGMTASVTITQQAAGYDLPIFRTIDDLTPAEMSPNGIYIGGVKQQVQADDSYEYTPILIEVATGKRIAMPISKESLQVMCVTDQGLMFCSREDMSTVCYKPDGTTFSLNTPSGFTWASVQATSEDGKVWVGFAYDPSTWTYYPFKWVDGVPQQLESPETNNIGEPIYNGVMARGCSADGSIIYGSIWDDLKDPVYWSKDGKVHLIGGELAEKKTGIVYHPMMGRDVEIEYYWSLVMNAEKSNISPNGKYIGISYSKAYIENKTLIDNKIPVVFDTETGALTVMDNFPTDVGVTTIDNNATIFGSTPSYGSSKGLVCEFTGTPLSSQEWIQKHFGVIIDGDMFICDISANGKTVLAAKAVQTLLGVSYRYVYITDNRK